MYGMLHGPVGYSSRFRIDLVGALLGEGCGPGASSKPDLMPSHGISAYIYYSTC